MAADAGGVREARERAQTWLSRKTPSASVSVKSDEFARDVLVLAAALAEAERERDEWFELHQALARDEYFARAERAEARLRDTEEALRPFAQAPIARTGGDHEVVGIYVRRGFVKRACRVLAAGGDTPEPADG